MSARVWSLCGCSRWSLPRFSRDRTSMILRDGSSIGVPTLRVGSLLLSSSRLSDLNLIRERLWRSCCPFPARWRTAGSRPLDPNQLTVRRLRVSSSRSPCNTCWYRTREEWWTHDRSSSRSIAPLLGLSRGSHFMLGWGQFPCYLIGSDGLEDDHFLEFRKLWFPRFREGIEMWVLRIEHALE